MQSQSSVQRRGEFTLTDLRGYEINIYNVPDGIEPVLLEVSSQDQEKILNTPRDGVGPITSLVGNLVFYDQERKEVNSFPSPVRLVFTLTPEDEKKREIRKEKLHKEFELIPAYLYSYYPQREDQPEKYSQPVFEVWRPFQYYTIDKEKNSVTIEFWFWGDQPIGPGTKPPY